MSEHSEYTKTTWIIEFNKATLAYADEIMRIFGNRIRKLASEIDDDVQLAQQVTKAFYAVKEVSCKTYDLELINRRYGD